MRTHPGNLAKSVLLVAISILGLVAAASTSIPRTRQAGFGSSSSLPVQTVPMGTTLVADSNIRFFDASPSVGTHLTNDTKIKFIDSPFDGHWVLGKTVVYDTNNNGVYDYGEPVIGGKIPSTGTTLSFDPKIKFVDTNLDGVWDPGETTVYERTGATSYSIGDPVIGGNPPIVGGGLATDSKTKYVGSSGNWILGNSVIYDSNSTGHYLNNTDLHIKYVDSASLGHWIAGDTVVYDADAGLSGNYAVGDKNLTGNAPAFGTLLKFDKLIKFLDPNRNGYWVQGDAIVYDSNNNNTYEAGEPIIVRSSPAIGTVLTTDSKVSYVDSGNIGHWIPGDTVVYDSNSNGTFDQSIDPAVAYYNSSGTSHWTQGEPVVYDPDHDYFVSRAQGDKAINGTLPPDGTPLNFDPHMRIVDTDLNGHWDFGEPVVYHLETDNIYDAPDVVIYRGNAGSLFIGVSLTEPVLVGAAPQIGTAVKVDPKMRYVESNGNTVWDFGESIIYDNNTNNVYDSLDTVVLGSPPAPGSVLHDPVIAGPVPTVGAILKSDSHIEFVNSTGVGHWVLGETVVYDGDGNNLYDAGEQVIAGGAGPDGVWDQGETVVYDSDSAINNTYASTDQKINGTVPLPGTVLSRDSRIKFVDTQPPVGYWGPGDTVIYDANNDNLYEFGKVIIDGSIPATLNVLQPTTALDSSGRVWLAWNEKPYGATKGTQVFFKIWNGTSWTSKQQVTNDPSNIVDNGNFVLSLPNQTMMIFWASNKTGHSAIFYRLYNSAATNPYPTSNPVQLTNSLYPDKSISAITDRYGRIWVSWARQNTTLTCILVCSNVYYKYFNGTSWSADFPLPPAASPALSETTPSISRTNDGRIWIFWATAPANVAGTTNLADATTDGTIQTLPLTGIPSSAWAFTPTFLSEGTDIDQPFMMQSRDGTLWVFYQSNDPTLPNQYIHYVNSTDLHTWNGFYALTANSNDGSPTGVQMVDHRIWIFWGRNSNLSQVDYTTSSPISNVAHLGIQRIAVGSQLVRSGWSDWINVTVANYGDIGETGLLTLSLNSTRNSVAIEQKSASYTAGNITTFRYNWTTTTNLSFTQWGRYNVTATLKPAIPETAGNSGDSSWSGGLLRISPPGDIDGNGKVDIIDASNIGIAFGSNPNSPNWNPYADVDRDGNGIIDILDAATLALYYGDSV
jgi:hypothetical protein